MQTHLKRFLACILIVTFCCSALFAQAAFSQRTTAPSLDDPYYTAPSNPYSNHGGIGNCVWYAFGRAHEILGYAPSFSGNACLWWNDRESYHGYGDEPRVGAIAVWDGIDASSAGHVAVVEAIDGDRITISESSYTGVSYTGTYWGSRTYSLEYMRNGLSYRGCPLYLLGFIYLTDEEQTEDIETEHEHTFAPFREQLHPHAGYDLCTGCGLRFDTEDSYFEESCAECIALQTGDQFRHFEKVNEYESGLFKDVFSGQWYEEGIASAYELGLMQGIGNSFFSTDGDVTIAEAVAMAARLHSIYYNGTAEFETSDTWYAPYVFYARKNGIISDLYEDYTKPATRVQVAEIFANALPASALSEINAVESNAIPDVALTAESADEIYRLYRAGVLTGSDEKGSFFPGNTIRRSEAAAIISRMAQPEKRKSISLKFHTSNLRTQVIAQFIRTPQHLPFKPMKIG